MATAKTLQDVGKALLGASPLEKAVAKNTVQRKAPLPKGKGIGSTRSINVSPVIAYPINKLPTWTLNPKGNDTPKYSQTTDRGYDIEAMRLNEVRRALAMAFANGALSTGMDPSRDTKMPFFVTGVNIDWALAGTTAQSRLTRDFYPHNFTQATLMVQGVSLNQYEYGEMVEFIHKAQHDALNGGNLIQLNISSSPGQLDGGRKTVTRGVRTTSQIIGDLNLPNQIVRGHHAPITCQGYVNGMQRRHQKGVFVPIWQFGFTVAVMIEGPYKEELHNLTKQKNWTDMLKGVSLLQTDWLKQNDQNALDWVRRESIHIFDVTQVATTSGSSSSTSAGGSVPSGTGGLSSSAPSNGGPSQTAIAATLISVGRALSAPDTAIVACLCAGFGESTMGAAADTYNPNVAGYWGVLQGGSGQKGSAANWPDPHDVSGQATSFYKGGKGYQAGGAIALVNGGETDPGTIATRVEASGEPGSYYGKFETQARAILAAYQTAPGGNVKAPTGDAQQLAQGILDSGKVTYGREVQNDLQAAANGRPGSAGAMLKTPILQLIAAVISNHSVTISALQSGGTGHSTGSDHYSGAAVDFAALDGVVITGRNTPAVTIMTIAMSVMSGGWFGQSGCGPTPTLPSSWSTGTDTCNHLHVSFR